MKLNRSINLVPTTKPAIFYVLYTVNFNKMKTILNVIVIVILMLLVALINQIANDNIMITLLLLWFAHTLRYVTELYRNRERRELF